MEVSNTLKKLVVGNKAKGPIYNGIPYLDGPFCLIAEVASEVYCKTL